MAQQAAFYGPGQGVAFLAETGLRQDGLPGALYVETATVAATGAGEADGAATVAGVGASLAAGAGEADGAASVSGASVVVAAGAGEADGSASVSGVGASLADGAGEADGSASVAGVGAEALAATGEADGSASVSGVGSIGSTAAGEADGSADVSGVGVAIATAGSGEADGSASVAGVSPTPVGAAGEADGQATVVGVGASIITPPLVFPSLPGIGFSIHRRPHWRTIVASYPSGGEQRAALWAMPLWEFELTIEGMSSDAVNYTNLGADSLQTMMGFYLQCGGQRSPFLWTDPDFNTAVLQTIAVGDGATMSFPLVRTFGPSLELISWATGLTAVYFNGVSQPSGWWLTAPGALNFAVAPGAGVVIKADFTYGFVCRFIDDTEDFEEFMHDLWTLKALKFRQVRAVAGSGVALPPGGGGGGGGGTPTGAAIGLGLPGILTSGVGL